MSNSGSHLVREAVVAVLAAAGFVASTTARGSEQQAPVAGGGTLELARTERVAQDESTTGSGSSPANPEMLEEVIVRGVAEKYRPDEQNSATGLAMKLVDTPQAITVLSSKMLEVIGADSIYHATDLIPGVNRIGVGFGFDKIASRGIVNQRQRINGIQLSAINLPLEGFAVERVEVVRGPATALYGVTGNFGGEINSILKRPSRETKLEVGAETGSFSTSRYSFDVTGAIPGSDGVLTARLAVKYDEFSPPVDLASGSISRNKDMILASLMWQITDDTRATVWGYRAKRKYDPYDGGALFLLGPKNLKLDKNIDPDTWYFSNPDQSDEATDLDALVVELVHDFPNEWQLKVQALYNKYDQSISYFYPFGPFGAYGAPADEAAIYTYDIERHNEELTYNVSLGGKFEAFGREHGFFLALEGVDPREPGEFTLLNSLFTGSIRAGDGGRGVYADGSPILPVDRSALGIRSQAFTDNSSFKASAQFLIDPVDRVKILAGVLYDRSKSDYRVTINGGRPLNPPNVQNTVDSNIVKRVGVIFDVLERTGPVDALKAYANYSEGFLPQILINAAGQPESRPREMTQYEIGMKGEFLDGAVGASVSLYDYKITNIPVGGTLIGSFGNFGNVKAEGNQKASGLEAELVGELLPGWNVAANYAYTATKIQDPSFNFTTPVSMVAKHKGSVASSYEFLTGPLKGLRIGGNVTVSGDYAFIAGLRNVNRWGQVIDGGHTRVDLNASYKGFTGRLEGLETYVQLRNIFDEPIFFSKEGSPSFGIVLSDQRAYHIGLRYRFE
jgi:outer membrane receptor for ferric coprogen and ferric-rhodotorulic acid